MTEQDKKLLLVDLCARLPYGVKVRYKSAGEGDVKLGYGNIGYVSELGRGWWLECKPYLRPMSSMTEEEYEEETTLFGRNTSWEHYDWLNAHHFDYRGFIEKGLALEAPTDMYNNKDSERYE